ncbi:MAG: hypothetical protein Q9210_004755, partial [Variospora velana]
LYCQDDHVVTIIVRDVKDPSPNSSRAPSYSLSFRERRTASGPYTVPDLPILNPVRHTSGGINLGSLESLDELPENEKVTLSLADGTLRTFSREYLACWIDSQLRDGKQLTDIGVQSFDHGVMVMTKLDRDVWERSLIRGPWKADFAPLWQKHTLALHERESTLASLVRTVPNFTQSCQNFIYHLRNFTADKGSRGRLDTTGHEFFLGPPYFDKDTAAKIYSLMTSRGTFQEVLRNLATQRIGAEICASHDLAPIFESVLGIIWDKEKRKGTSFQHQMQEAEISSEGSRMQKLRTKGSKLFSDVFQKGKRGGGSGERGRRSGGGSSGTGTGSSVA